MIIYGVALLGVCLLVGVFLGELLGQIIGVKANVGGVGISMLLLIFLSHWRPIKEKLADGAASGVLFWNAMYSYCRCDGSQTECCWRPVGWLACYFSRRHSRRVEFCTRTNFEQGK